MGFHPDGASKTEKAIGGNDLNELRFRMEI